MTARHFPERFEVVRADEVVEGERTLDTAIKKELETEPGLAAFNQMLKIGKFARSTSLDEKDVAQITESRIIDRRMRGGKSTGSDGFANLANQAPSLDIIPNGVARKRDKGALPMAKKLEADKDSHKEKSLAGKMDEKKTEAAHANFKSRDDGVLKASGSTCPGH